MLIVVNGNGIGANNLIVGLELNLVIVHHILTFFCLNSFKKKKQKHVSSGNIVYSDAWQKILMSSQQWIIKVSF